jgi:hypothetical protein
MGMSAKTVYHHRMKKWRILQNSFISILQLSKIYHRGLKVEVSKNDAA